MEHHGHFGAPETDMFVPAARPDSDQRKTAPTMTHDPGRIRILSVDDHPLLRAGIAGLIADEADMVLVGEAENGRQAIEQFERYRPDVTLMDLQMPEMNGLDALEAIRARSPEARIIVLTTYPGDAQVMRAIKAGAYGYLMKSTLRKELLSTIRAVHAGKRALSPELTYGVVEHVGSEPLSPTEVRVLRLIADGNSNKDIAAELALTEEAVKGQVRSILSKLGANDRTHAAVLALKRGIIS
jgi:DNA-binding NarL/FixJ family response regulator